MYRSTHDLKAGYTNPRRFTTSPAPYPTTRYRAQEYNQPYAGGVREEFDIENRVYTTHPLETHPYPARYTVTGRISTASVLKVR